jgi:hypothetical protein
VNREPNRSIEVDDELNVCRPFHRDGGWVGASQHLAHKRGRVRHSICEWRPIEHEAASSAKSACVYCGQSALRYKIRHPLAFFKKQSRTGRHDRISPHASDLGEGHPPDFSGYSFQLSEAEAHARAAFSISDLEFNVYCGHQVGFVR